MQLEESTPPVEGEFTIRVKDKDGNVVYTATEHNMIVNGAKTALATLIANADSHKCVTKFGVGTGTTAAMLTDTQLLSQYTKGIDKYDLSVAGRVTFSWSLGAAEANGLDITEFGLFCEDGTLFSHKVRDGAIRKEDDLSFEGDWTILF